MKSRKFKIAAAAFVAAFAAALVIAASALPRRVAVARPTSKLVLETIAASGSLEGATESNIGAQDQGRIAAILVREGDQVRAGQVIARLDDSVLTAQVTQADVAVTTAQATLAQAEAAVGTTQATLAQAARPPLASDVVRLRADVAQADGVNAANLASAQQRAASAWQHLQELRHGARPEEIAQSQAEMRQAQATLVQDQRDLDRQTALFQQQVISRAEYEQAQTTLAVGQQNAEDAQAKLRQLQAGSRTEDVAQAEADYGAAQAAVVSAQAALQGGRASGQAQIASLLATPRPEDVAVAQARLVEAEKARGVAQDQLAEAQTGLTLARSRLSQSSVTAPFAGTVTQVVTEVGAVTAPSAPIIRLVRTSRPELRVDLDESNLGKVQIGQQAVVTNDAFPDSRFTAVVHAIGAKVGSV